MIQAGTQGSELLGRGFVRIVEIEQVGLRRGPVWHGDGLRQRSVVLARADRLGSYGYGMSRSLGIPDGLHGGEGRLRRGSYAFGPP